MPNTPRCEPTYAFKISTTTLLTALAASMFELKKRKIFCARNPTPEKSMKSSIHELDKNQRAQKKRI